MKLSKVLLSLVTEGARSVTLSAIGTPYSVTYSRARDGLKYVMQTTIAPEPDAQAEELPDEVECLLAQAETYGQHIAHFLSCSTHAPMVALEMSDLHNAMERAKTKYPHMSELTFEGIVVSLSTGLSLYEAVGTGIAQEKLVNKEPSAEERAFIESMNDGQGPGMDFFDPRVITDVVLDYEPLSKPLTDEDKTVLADFYQKREAEYARKTGLSMGSLATKSMQVH